MKEKINILKIIKYPLSIFLMTLLIESCGFEKEPLEVKKLRENYQEFLNVDYSFSSGIQYYQMQSFDIEKLVDTIEKVHQIIFDETFPLEELNKQISRWLRDSIFVGTSQAREGLIIMDTVNLLNLDNPVDYYLNSEIKAVQNISGKLFRPNHFAHTVPINKKNISYQIYPTNGKLINEIGEYRIETTGDYIPKYMYVGGRSSRSNLRYFCDQYLIDWFIIISSDHFLNGGLSMKISDTTLYYNTRKDR